MAKKKKEQIPSNPDASWEFLQASLWYKYNLSSTQALEDSFAQEKEGVILSLENGASSYVHLPTMTETIGVGNQTRKVRRLTKTNNQPAWSRTGETVVPLRCTVTKTTQMACDEQLAKIVTGHESGDIAFWELRESGKGLDKGSHQLALKHRTKVSANSKILCIDTYQGWTVFAVAPSGNKHVEFFLLGADVKQAPFFIARGNLASFGNSIKLHCQKQKNAPDIFVALRKGGLTCIRYLAPHLWNSNEDGAPMKRHEHWTEQNVALAPGNTSLLHVVPNKVLISVSDDQNIQFRSLVSSSYGKQIVHKKAPSKNSGNGKIGICPNYIGCCPCSAMPCQYHCACQYHQQVQTSGNLNLGNSKRTNLNLQYVAIDHYAYENANDNTVHIVIASKCGTFEIYHLNQQTIVMVSKINAMSAALPNIKSFRILGNPKNEQTNIPLCILTQEGKTFGELTLDEPVAPENNETFLSQRARNSDELVLVDKTSREFRDVSDLYSGGSSTRSQQQQFQHRGGGNNNTDYNNTDIKNVYRVQNVALWEKYQGHIQRKQRSRSSSSSLSSSFSPVHNGECKQSNNEEEIEGLSLLSSCEKRLFHGTSSSVVENILRQGFDFRLAGKHGSAHGSGVNFARDSSYSLGYVNRDHRNNNSGNGNGNGNICMFLARVFVGRSAKSIANARRPPPIDPRDPAGELYDSTVNSVSNPSIHVIYDNAQAYPEYVIELHDHVVNGGGSSRSTTRSVNRSSGSGGFSFGGSTTTQFGGFAFGGSPASFHSSNSSNQQRQCKNWVRNGSCRFGANCRFSHSVNNNAGFGGFGGASSGPGGFGVASGFGTCNNVVPNKKHQHLRLIPAISFTSASVVASQENHLIFARSLSKKGSSSAAAAGVLVSSISEEGGSKNYLQAQSFCKSK